MSAQAEERRKFPRLILTSPISYLCVDSDDQSYSQNMGVARNISKEGIHVETLCRVDAEYLILAFTDRKRNIMEIKGKVIYSQSNDSGKYDTGVHFTGEQTEYVNFVKELVMSYHASEAADF